MCGLLLALVLSAAPVKDAGSPGRAVSLAYTDCLSLPTEDQPYVRYLWISSDRKYRDDFLIGISFHLNLLSVQPELKHPTLIAGDLIRIDVRDYGWYLEDENKVLRNILPIWEKFAALDKMFHQKAEILKSIEFQTVWPGGFDPNHDKEFKRGKYKQERSPGSKHDLPAVWLPNKEINALRLMTYSEAPILMAEWFFVQTARQISIRNKLEGVGYYDFLGLKDRKAFFDLTGTDEKLAIARFSEWRAVVEKSGISQQNRQVVRLGALDGGTWGTLDTFTQEGRGIAIRNLRRGEFVHNAEEYYSGLPNKLPVTFLSDNKGVAQASAPDQIGGDDSALRIGKDPRVHANISCMRCHGVDKDMLRPIDDSTRKMFKQGGVLHFADKNKFVQLELSRQYLRSIDDELDKDRAVYAKAIRNATVSKKNPKGLISAQITKIYCEVWNRYADTQLTAADCARELGVSEVQLIESLKKYNVNRKLGDMVLNQLLADEPMKVSRLNFEDSYALAQMIVMGVALPEIEERKK